MRTLLAPLLLITLFFSGCAAQNEQLAALDKGYGGTGHLTCPDITAAHPGDSGFGGTGHRQCGFGGTGVIGTITDFGSIWVNGLEISLTPNVRISSNLGHPVKLAIGQQVVTHTAADALVTDQIEVFYPVAGRVESTNGQQVVVAGQTIQIDAGTQGLKHLKPGQFVAINGWPRPDGSWMATRIDPNPHHVQKVARPELSALRVRHALLEGTVLHEHGRTILAPYGLTLTSEQVRNLNSGTLAIVRARREQAHWIAEQIQPLRTWRTDWRELQEHARTAAESEKPHHEHDAATAIRETHESRQAQEALRDNRESAMEGHEQARDMRMQRDNMRNQREQLHDLYEQRENFGTMYEMYRRAE